MFSWVCRLVATRRRPPRVRRARVAVEELEGRLVPTLLGDGLFPADNPWNQKITNAPLAGNSSAIINNIITTYSDGRLHPDFGQDARSSNPLYGIPYNVVHGNTTTKVHVVIGAYASQSDVQDAPIPANAVIEGDKQNGPTVGLSNRGDSHLIVWDEDNNIAYEFYQASRPSENGDGNWHAVQESVWNMNTDTFRTIGWTSADAAGLSILAGLVRPDEGLPVGQGGQGVINHAIRFTLQNNIILNQFLYPAEHVANPGNTDLAVQPPMGARFRLKASVDISQLNPQSRIIAQAMKDYGMIVADNGSNFFFSGASYSVDASNQFALTWNDNDIQDTVHGLKSLTFDEFEVVDLTPIVTSLSISSGPAGSSLTVTGQNFSGAAGHLQVLFGGTAATSITIVDDAHVTAVVPAGSGTVDVRVQSGVTTAPNSQNIKNTIFGYGISAASTADHFTFITSGPANHFKITAPASATAGTSFTFTVTAEDSSNNTATGYTGTVHFTSSDAAATLPANVTLTTGSGTFTATLRTAGNRVLTATDTAASTVTGASGPIAVGAASATHFAVGTPLTAVTGAALSVTVTAQDTFNNLATGYGGTVVFASSDAAANLPANSPLSSGTGTFTATLNTSGNQTLTATDTVNTAITGSSSPIFTTGLTVTAFAPTPTGFTASFSKPFINSSTNPVHIYDAASAGYGAADVTLIGASAGTIRGSLIISATNTGFTFIKTGGPAGGASGLLSPDTYTVTFVSGGAAFQSIAGEALDGQDSVLNINTGKNNNYITSFTVAASSAVAVSIPNFARGPGQPSAPDSRINVPNNAGPALGIPISVSDGNGVTDGTFVLSYDSTLLTISGNGTVNPSLGNATFALVYSGSGASSLATITFHSPTPLAAGAVQLGGLFAAVPSSAPYKAKELLHFTSVSLNNGAIAATGVDGVHVVAFLGDASGDGLYTSYDAVLLSRAAAHADSGFAAFPAVDPVIVADVNADGAVTSGDGVLLNRYLAGGTVAQLPVYPGAPSNVAAGPDPTLSVPALVRVSAGSTVAVPVMIDDPRPAGSSGLTQATLALTFDPRLLSVSAADIHMGTVPASGAGWFLQAVVDMTSGQIGITLFSTTPIATSTGGSLVIIDFHVRPGARPGAASVDLVAAVNPNGQGLIRTALDDNQGPLTVHLATNEGGIDCRVLVTALVEAQRAHSRK